MGFIRNQVSNKIPNRSDIKTSLYYPYVANYSAASAASPGIDSYTKLMLHMDGDELSTTFTDSALTPKTVTANGNARIQQEGIGKTVTANGSAQISTSEKKIGTSSISLASASSSYLSIPDSADWNFGSGEFCIRFWVKFSSFPANDESMTFISQYGDANNNWRFGIYNAAGAYQLNLVVRSGGTLLSDEVREVALSTNIWYHIEIDRIGNTVKFFLDGTKKGNDFSFSSSIPDVSGLLNIGRNGAGTQYLNGYIDELEIVKGTYRNNANFTPYTTALTADTYTKLLLHFEGSNASTVFLDDSENIRPKFGTGLGYFDGSGDYLTVPDSDDWHFTGDLTIDLWVYPSANSTGNRMLFGQAADNFCPIELWWQTDRVIKTYLSFDNTTWVTGTAVISSTAIALGTWTHIALVRSGSTFTFYLNGTQSGLKYNSTSAFTNSTNSLHIAYDTFNGYMDELRISNGIARYTTTFTPSTAPYST